MPGDLFAEGSQVEEPLEGEREAQMRLALRRFIAIRQQMKEMVSDAVQNVEDNLDAVESSKDDEPAEK